MKQKDIMQLKSKLSKISKNLESVDTSIDEVIPITDQVIKKYMTQKITELDGLFKENRNIDANLTEFLSKNWRFVKNNMCCYTALPEDALTLLLCDIAESLAKDSNDDKKFAINFLMPEVVVNHLSDESKDLTRFPLKQVLKTHITSDCGNYLIPVNMLMEIKVAGDTYDNPFFDYRIGGNSRITEKELLRLQSHSDKVAALVRIDSQLKRLTNANSFFAELTELNQSLGSNSASGSGTETMAGREIYTFLVDFSVYWRLLGDGDKGKLPADIVKLIESLILVVSDRDSRRENEVDQTCLGSIYRRLKDLIKANKDKLECFQVGIEKENYIKAMREEKESRIAVLQKAFDSNSYKGTEKLDITADLITQLDVLLKINVESCLIDLFENTSVLQLERLINAKRLVYIRRDFSVENFVSQLLLLDDDKAKLFVSLVAKKAIQNRLAFDEISRFFLWDESLKFIDLLISSGFFSSADDLCTYRVPFTKEQADRCYDKLKGSVYNKMQDNFNEDNYQIEGDFVSFVSAITTEQLKDFCDKFIKNDLSKYIPDVKSFTSIMNVVSYDKAVVILDKIDNHLFAIISELTETDQDIAGLITNMVFYSDYQKVMHELFQRVIAFDINSIQSPGDLYFVRELVTVEAKNKLYEQMKQKIADKLKSKINNVDEHMCKSLNYFASIVEVLTADQLEEFCSMVSGYLPRFISDFDSLQLVLRQLPYKKSQVICEAIGDYFLEIIPDVDAVIKLLDELQSSQFRFVVHEYDEKTVLAFDKYLPTLLQQEDQFFKFLNVAGWSLLAKFSDNTRAELVELAVKYIGQASELRLYREFYAASEKIVRAFGVFPNEEKRKICCKVIDDPVRINDFVQTDADFFEAMSVLRNDTEHKKKLYDAKQEFFCAMIKRPASYATIAHELTQAQRNELYEKAKKDGKLCIETASDFASIYKYLDHEGRKKLYNETQLKDLFENAKEFFNVCQTLTAVHRTQLYNDLKNEKKLLSLIKGISDFSNICCFLDDRCHSYIYENTKKDLVAWVEQCHHISAVLKHLNKEQKSEFFGMIEDKLSNLIRSRTGDWEFENLWNHLEVEQILKLCKQLKIKFPKMSSFEFKSRILGKLNKEQVQALQIGLHEHHPGYKCKHQKVGELEQLFSDRITALEADEAKYPFFKHLTVVESESYTGIDQKVK